MSLIRSLADLLVYSVAVGPVVIFILLYVYEGLRPDPQRKDKQ